MKVVKTKISDKALKPIYIELPHVIPDPVKILDQLAVGHSGSFPIQKAGTNDCSFLLII